MEIVNLSDDERRLVKVLCGHQFQSLKRLYYETVDKDILEWVKANRTEYGVSDEDYKKNLIKRARLIQSIEKNPERVMNLPESELSIIKTILSAIEDEWKVDYPYAVADLWAKFFFYEKNNKPLD